MKLIDNTDNSLYKIPMTFRFRVLLILLLLLANALAFGQQTPPAKSADTVVKGGLALTVKASDPFTFVAYGDLRKAPLTNTKSTDPVRTKAILDSIAAAKPAFVEVGGDLVLQGDEEANWRAWEDDTSTIRHMKIPVFPAIGNHELMRDASKGLEKYFHHFPFLKQNRYYSVRAANTITFVLDSALDEISGPQGDWLQQQFDALSPDIDFVFVLLHHPPYTRSGKALGGGHSARPREIALAHWLENRQQSLPAKIVVIAGHVHNYERYSYGGVTYVVSGGGGATPYVIPREPDDAYQLPGPAYSYCLIKVLHGQMTLEMKRLDMVDGKAVWSTGDSVTLTADAAKRADQATAAQ